MDTNHPLYDEVMAHSFMSVQDYFSSSREREKPFEHNAATIARFAIAGTARHIRAMESSMPNLLKEVNRDVLASESLAFFIRALYSAGIHRHKTAAPESLFGALNHLGTIPMLVRSLISEIKAQFWADVWWHRWCQYLKHNQLPVQFNQYGYFLSASRGSHLLAENYGPPPPSLYLNVTIERPIAEIAFLKNLDGVLDALVELAPKLADEDEPAPDEAILDEQASVPEQSILPTLEHAARLATQDKGALDEMRRLISLALKLRQAAVAKGATTDVRCVAFTEALSLLDQCHGLDQFMKLCRSRF